MSFGHVTITLRPIKFAMLVNYSDPEALIQAIRINTFLWGGVFNPIIPVFQKTPDNWSDRPLPPPTPNEIVLGYVRFFDPDVLVTCGTIDPSVIQGVERRMIAAADITGPIVQDGIPGYGIGLFEILAALGEKEFKFVRKDNLKVLAPIFDSAAEPFLATIYGDVPPEAGGFYEECLKYVETERPTITFDNFLDFSSGHFLFRRHICNYRLDIDRPMAERGDAIFFLDHTIPLDVIDFWNLRAVGWDVLPLPKKIAATDKAKLLARTFINEHEDHEVIAPYVGNRVTIIKSRSINKDDHVALINSLRENPNQIMSCQFWYPPMWDEFTHVRGHLRCSDIVADTREIIIGDEATTIRMSAFPPEFLGQVYREGCRYANDLRVSNYGLKDFGCEVIPRDEPSIKPLLGFGFPDDWRVGANGLTFLGSHTNETIHLEQPNPRAIAATILTARGYTAFRFSPAGNVAYQIIKHLGGTWGIGLLKSRMLIEYLEHLSRGSGRSALAQNFFGQMKRINEALRFPGDVHGLVQRYTDAKIFTLGLEIQCLACTQRSWFPVDGIDYELLCPKCLAKFKLPIHSPTELKWAYKNLGPFVSPSDEETENLSEHASEEELKWGYKSLGPFAAPKQGGGSYSVLLAVDFLRKHHHPRTTPILSFSAKSKSGEELEADFMMFYRGSGFSETQTEWVFGECKTFNKFKQRDIDRMQLIANDFPHSVLVFATLQDEFSQEEKDLLVPFVKSCRAYGKLDRPRNPVLLLTGTELFSLFGPPVCWENKGGKAKEFVERGRRARTLLALCELTQSLYLDLGPWGPDWDTEFKRRREAAIP